MTDLLGLAPYADADAVNTVVEGTVTIAKAFLKAVCQPALEEFGFMLKDQVGYWKTKNLIKMLEKCEGRLDYTNGEFVLKSNPRVALAIIENASLIDDDGIQELWAGLFVSSCKMNVNSDENLIFANLLKQLTVLQASIIRHSCINSRKILYENGLITGDKFVVSIEELMIITGEHDIHRLDRELDHLCSIDLIHSQALSGGGFSGSMDKLEAIISPSALALNLFMKTQGVTGSPEVFWKDSLIHISDLKLENEN